MLSIIVWADEARTQNILKVWTKEKKGLPVTWENLIKTLIECGIMDLARTLEYADTLVCIYLKQTMVMSCSTQWPMQVIMISPFNPGHLLYKPHVFVIRLMPLKVIGNVLS